MGGHDINIGAIIVQYICLLFSLCVHEAAHALAADRCGDPSARLMGRATLNPLAHIDPMGTVILPLLMMFTGIPFLFGWAKPVPFNPRNLRNMRRDPALIALAGPMANLLMMVLFVVILRGVVVAQGLTFEARWESPLFVVMFSMVMINMVLMMFNLIPVPPLDGGHLLYAFLPASGQRLIEQIGPFGILIAMFVASQFLQRPLGLLQGLVYVFAFWGRF